MIFILHPVQDILYTVVAQIMGSIINKLSGVVAFSLHGNQDDVFGF